MNSTTAWITLVLAGLFEIGWAVGLKYTDGFSRFLPTVWTLLSMTVSFLLLGMAVKILPIGSAYSVWVGIGAVGTVICGILFLGESASLIRILSMALIITGIIGLKLTTDI